MNKGLIKVAVNAFMLKEGKLLLGRRKNVSGDGDWGLPGGHLEFFEKLSEGLKRELKEEIGIENVNPKFLQIINDPRIEDNSHYLHVNFLVENFAGEPKLMEPEKCHEWKWFSFDDLPKNIFLGHRSSIKCFLGNVSILD